MKKQHSILLALFSLLLIGACTNTTTPIPDPVNPCRPVSLRITIGNPIITIPTPIILDGKGTDTIDVQTVSVGRTSYEYRVFAYDSDGLPTSLHMYEGQNFELAGSYQMQWWEEDVKKEIKEYAANGDIKGIELYDMYGNWDRTQKYYQGNWASDHTYVKSYSSNNLLTEAIKYITNTTDTVYRFTWTYDADDKLISEGYSRKTRIRSLQLPTIMTQQANW